MHAIVACAGVNLVAAEAAIKGVGTAAAIEQVAAGRTVG